MDYIFDQADIDGNGLLKTKELQYSSFLVADLLLKEGLAALARVGRDPHLGAVGGGGGRGKLVPTSPVFTARSASLLPARHPLANLADPPIHLSTRPLAQPPTHTYSEI